MEPILKSLAPVQLQEGEQVWIETPQGIVIVSAIKTMLGDGLTLITGADTNQSVVTVLVDPQEAGKRAFVVELRQNKP